MHMLSKYYLYILFHTDQNKNVFEFFYFCYLIWIFFCAPHLCLLPKSPKEGVGFHSHRGGETQI